MHKYFSVRIDKCTYNHKNYLYSNFETFRVNMYGRSLTALVYNFKVRSFNIKSGKSLPYIYQLCMYPPVKVY